jgi:hypothetical protein
MTFDSMLIEVAIHPAAHQSVAAPPTVVSLPPAEGGDAFHDTTCSEGPILEAVTFAIPDNFEGGMLSHSPGHSPQLGNTTPPPISPRGQADFATMSHGSSPGAMQTGSSLRAQRLLVSS